MQHQALRQTRVSQTTGETAFLGGEGEEVVVEEVVTIRGIMSRNLVRCLMLLYRA